ncbi:hypothetical protein BSL78_08335 [Apostichopus japonicus]|uniref:PNPLA domain-containing protein n=1 Tax=Stichopus japonicus TaxID=307972 RepID=A0A2G8L3H3_STIJA|nr:hypothetical protein BSL78_08335 [Apostichopus japonicus]
MGCNGVGGNRRGKKYIDGGLTHNLPVYPFSGSTIFVSPFSGCQHICPKDENRYSFFVDLSGHRFKLNGQNVRRGLHGFLSPSEDTFMKYYEVGVKDTTEFLKENDCYQRLLKLMKMKIRIMTCPRRMKCRGRVPNLLHGMMRQGADEAPQLDSQGVYDTIGLQLSV